VTTLRTALLTIAVASTVAIASALAFATYQLTRPKPTDDEHPAYARNADGSLVSETAVSLIDAYRENEIAADRKYKGHLFFVKGTVIAVTRDRDGEALSALYGAPGRVDASGYAAQVVLRFHDEYAASALRAGKDVVLRCTGAGMTPADHVSLKDCVVTGE
jgi:hypothetical protein